MYAEPTKVKVGRTVYSVRYHRNGVGGEGFHTVCWRGDGDNMVAVVFEGEGQVAVLNRDHPEHRYKGDDVWGKTCRDAIKLADEMYEEKAV